MRLTLAMGTLEALDKIHRIEFTEMGIDVISLGLESTDAHFNTPEDMPEWMRDRLAVLMMMSYEPPTKLVTGVGRRIDERIFWVIEPDKLVGN